MSININHVIQIIIKNVQTQLDKGDKALGVLTSSKKILPLGNDSKMVGRLFEILSEPALENSAHELGLHLEPNAKLLGKQTDYPDYIMDIPNSDKKIAVDIKSTYRSYNKTASTLRNGTQTNLAPVNFTLGSFTSFLRGDGSKNIIGNYKDYAYHLILGFLYSRNTKAVIKAMPLKHLLKDKKPVEPPYKNIEFFVQQKYKIGGDTKGSGNTDNIGTIKSRDLNDFRQGNSYFTYLGNNIFEDYWRHHSRNTDSSAKKKSLFNNINEYINWVANDNDYRNNPARHPNPSKAKLLKKKYNKWQKKFQPIKLTKHGNPIRTKNNTLKRTKYIK